MTDASLPLRRFKACLVLTNGYLLIALFVLLVWTAAISWGVGLPVRESRVLGGALAFHGAGVALASGLLLLANRRAAISPTCSGLALAAMPFVFLLSIDRIAAVSYPPIPPQTTLQAHPVRGWTNRPGWVETVGDRTIRINRKGLRGPEVPYEKAAGERRILFLGDSIAFGVLADEGESFVDQLPRVAAKYNPSETPTVINCSATGYSPWQEYDLLESECLKYDPDVVVQVFCLNDVVAKFQLQQFGGQTRGLEPRVPSPLEWSGLFRMSRAVMADLLSRGYAEHEQCKRTYSVTRIIEEPDAPEIRAAWAIVLENLHKIHALAREHEVPLAIVCFPYAEQLSPYAPDTSPPQEQLAAFAEQEGIPFLDLMPVYRWYCRQKDVLRRTGRNWEGLAILPDRSHPTPEGHRLAAEEIYAFLVSEGFLH